jgi:hypothetical protein
MTIIELFETFLGPLDNTFGKLIVSVMFIAVFAIGLGFVGVSKILIFLTVLVSIFMFAAFGWIPLWIVVMIGIGLFVLAYTNIRGGSNA